jgi:hypothetical protein
MPEEIPNPFRRRRGTFNSLKIRALSAFENRGWLNPPVWSVLVGFYPARASYTYLLRLHRFRLLDRRHDAQGHILYALSDLGVKRLSWLRANSKPKAALCDRIGRRMRGSSTPFRPAPRGPRGIESH